jgi:hypothetical protein
MLRDARGKSDAYSARAYAAKARHAQMPRHDADMAMARQIRAAALRVFAVACPCRPRCRDRCRCSARFAQHIFLLQPACRRHRDAVLMVLFCQR